jgi:hypothetical protein
MLDHEGYLYHLQRKTDLKLIFHCKNPDCKSKFIQRKNVQILLMLDQVGVTRIQSCMPLFLNQRTIVTLQILLIFSCRTENQIK